MRKTLRDVARYLKEIMVPETYEAYAINPVFANTPFGEDKIREGVLAFRTFLVRLYDVLDAKADIYDTCGKAAHGYENRTSLSVYYPFLYNVSIILKNMGYQGIPDEGGQSLLCGSTVLNRKLSVNKNLECLRFLTDCGICVEGIDINNKKQDFSNIKAIRITYPDNPVMLTGLKEMAIAEIEHGTLVNQDVFLRCDYRALKKDETDALLVVRDTIRPLSPDVQELILHLHRRYMNKGLTCAVEVKGFHIYIKYCYKRKDLWGINVSLNNGYHINVKPTKTNEYADVVKTFPQNLQRLIEKGYGCGRKREAGRCDGGCRGLTIPLDDSVLGIRNYIETWFDQELSCLQKK